MLRIFFDGPYIPLWSDFGERFTYLSKPKKKSLKEVLDMSFNHMTCPLNI